MMKQPFVLEPRALEPDAFGQRVKFDLRVGEHVARSLFETADLCWPGEKLIDVDGHTTSFFAVRR